MKKSNICFLDFETSGIDVYTDSPIEIGAVLLETNGEIISEFHSFIKPRTDAKFSKEAIKVHGINKEDLTTAPLQNEVLESFFESFGNDFRFGGWNVSFTYRFLKSMCHHSNKIDLFNKISHRHIDVQSISYVLNEINLFNSEVNSLSDLCKYFSLHRREKHSALEDAKFAGLF